MKINEKVLKTFRKVTFVISVTLKFLSFVFCIFMALLLLMNDSFAWDIDVNSIMSLVCFWLSFSSVTNVLDFFNGVSYGQEVFDEEKKETSEEVKNETDEK